MSRQAGGVPGRDQRAQRPIGHPVGGAARQAGVEGAGRGRGHGVLDVVGALQPRGAGSDRSQKGSGAETLTDAGAAPVAAERTAALDGVAGTGRPQQVDQQVGRRRGREQHPLPARGHVDAGLLGGQAAAHLGRCASEVHVGEVASRPARPRRALPDPDLPHSSKRAAGWSCRSRRPPVVPRYVLVTLCSA